MTLPASVSAVLEGKADESYETFLARKLALVEPSGFEPARMAFVGLTDSWEAYFQAVRRCWRFGQTRPVEVHVYASELEGAVVKNLERKAADAERMAEELSTETAGAVKEQMKGVARLRANADHTKPTSLPEWLRTRGA